MRVADRWASTVRLSRSRRIAKALLDFRLSRLFVRRVPVAFRPGHSQSPICNPREVARHISNRDPDCLPETLPGIELNHGEQVALWTKWNPHMRKYASLRDQTQTRFWPASADALGEAAVLYCMLRHARPRRLVAFGTPQAILTALDAQDFDNIDPIDCAYIDPKPELLSSTLEPRDLARIRVIPGSVEVIRFSPGLFETLSPGDILYVDSTHVLKTASDVNHLIFGVLPILKQGVIVRFGTVMYPFEYPKLYTHDLNYSWNEVYALRAFMMYNSDFQITFFNDYFARTAREFSMRDTSLVVSSLGNDLWLTRRK